MQEIRVTFGPKTGWPRYLKWGAFYTLAAFSTASEAACSFIGNAHKATLNVTLPNLTRNPGINDYVSASLTVGQGAIASAFGVTNGQTFVVNCTAGESLIYDNSDFTPVGGTSNFAKTNVPGITLNAQGQSASTWVYPKNGGSLTRAIPSNGMINPFYMTTGGGSGGYVIVHQVVSGKLSQGGQVTGGRLVNVSTSDGLDIMDVIVSGFTLTVPTCTINSYSPQVDLGSVFTQRMKGIDSVTNPTPFAIKMACAATTGLASGLTPTLTFSGDTDGSKLNVFANKGSASGVGVQLTYGGSVVMPNQVTSLGKLTSSASQSRDYNFVAQLYQTAERVTPGSVNATATFTLDYQ